MKRTWLNGKTVIISGASSGIGLETARQLIDGYGCSVIGIAQNIAKLTKAKELLGSNFSYYSFDVKSEENLKNFRDNLLEKGIIPDILINNAGILPRFSRFEKYSDREIEDVLRINFLSAVYAVRTLLPLIGQSKTPSVINISSSAALAPVVGNSLYTASKAALKSFTECLQLESKERYVAFVCPGFVKTDIFRNQSSGISDSKLIERFCSPCEKTVRKLVRKIAKKKKRIILGADAYWSDIAYRLFPRSVGKIIGSVLKKSKQNIFSGIFEE